MSADGQEIAQFFADTLTFNPLHWDAAPETQVSHLARWLMSNVDEWRVPRITNSITPQAQSIQIFVGEAGTGKTTELRRQAELLRASGCRVLLLDFTNATEVQKRQEDRQFYSNLRRFLEKAVRGLIDSGLLDKRQFYAVRARYVLDQVGFGTENARTLLEIKYPNTLIRNLSDEVLLAEEEVQKAVSNYEQGAGDTMYWLRVVQGMPDRRLVVLMDNMDQLQPDRISMITDILQSAIHGATAVFLAARFESFTSLNRSHAREVTVHDFDLFSHDHLTIAERRAHAAMEYCVAQGLDGQQVSQIGDRTLDWIAEIANDDHSSSLVSRWQNGNLRQILAFITNISQWSIPHTQRSVRGRLYTTLVGETLPPVAQEIFSPTRYESETSRYPFLFLPLRLLAYLNHGTAGKVSNRGEVISAFRETFGLNSGAIDEALRSLETQMGNVSGAFIRQQRFEDQEYIVLLPAGRMFVTEIVCSADFLSWVYRQSTKPFKNVVQDDPQRPRQVKLDRACIVLVEQLLPAFEMEHPYMRSLVSLPKAEVRRFLAYRSLFGYGINEWFIQSIVAELERYATRRPIRLSNQYLKMAQQEVGKATGRLDQLVRESTGASV